jgi:thiol:disulfide interchange protein
MSPTPRPFPVAWLLLLLLLPAGFLAGRLVAGMSEPAPARETAATPSGPVEHAAPAPGGHASTGGLAWVSVEAAFAESRRTGKPVLFDFNADWCPPCQRMKRDVFDDPARARAIEAAVVPVAVVDRYRETGTNPPEVDELQRRFGIEAFPTLVAFSPETGKFVKDAGFGGADYTVEWIANAARQVK